MIISDKLYDLLKWCNQYLLPGLATLYFALGSIWGLPYIDQIIGTLMAVNVFLGAILGISTVTYLTINSLERSGARSFNLPVYNTTSEDCTNVRIEAVRGIDETTYQFIRWAVTVLLPTLGSLYSSISQLWGLPFGGEILGTIAAVTAFAGLLLGISTSQYRKNN